MMASAFLRCSDRTAATSLCLTHGICISEAVSDPGFVDDSCRRKSGILAGTRLFAFGAGVTMMEYRNKTGREAEILSDAAILRQGMPAQKVKLILDDRADLVEEANLMGCTLMPEIQAGRGETPGWPDRIIGTFGGSGSLLPGILDAPVDYLAIGPVFETRTKHTEKSRSGSRGSGVCDKRPGQKLFSVRPPASRFETAQAVLEAGATMVAVAEAIFRTPIRLQFARWILQIG